VNANLSKIVAFKGTIRKFLNVVVAQTEGLWYPPIHCKKIFLKIQEYIHAGANQKSTVPEFSGN
jgi:hypothetical protein